MSFDAGTLRYQLEVAGEAKARHAIDEFQRSADSAGKTAEKSAEQTSKMASATDKAAASARTGKTATDAEAGAKRDSAKASDRQAQATDQHTQSTKRAIPPMQSFRKEIVGMSDEGRRAATDIGQVASVIGGGLVLQAGLSARAAINWQSAWAGVQKTVDGNAEQMTQLEGGLRDLSTRLPASAEEIAAVAEAAGQLGVKREDILGFTETMINLGETTNLTRDQAATSLAQLMNIMGTSGDDVSRLASTVVALGNAGASTESEIVAMAQRIAGSGKLVGATEGEVLGLANALASMGVTAELGGGVASRVLQDLYSAVQNGGDDLRGFAQVAGMTSDEFAKAFGDDPVRALGTFATGLNGVEASGGNVVKTLTDLGFRSTEEQRILLQLKGAGDLLTDSLDLQATAWEANMALQAEADKRYETTEAQLQVMQNKINDVAIDMGAIFLPALNAGADVVGNVASAIADLPPEVQGMISSLGLGAGAITLTGGAALIAVPKILEMHDTAKRMRTEMPRTASAVGLLAKGLGLIAGLAAAATVLNAIAASSKPAAIGVEEIIGVLNDADTAKLKDTTAALDQLFTVGGASVAGETRSSVEGIDDALAKLLSNDVNSWVNREIGGGLNNMLGGQMLDSTKDAEQTFRSVGDALSQMVASGDGDRAAKVFESIAKRAEEQGYSTEQVLELMHPYQEALNAAANEGDELAQKTDEANQKMADSVGVTESAIEVLARFKVQTDEDIEAYQKWVEMISDSDAAFVDIAGAYDTATSRAQAMKDGTLDAWEEQNVGVTVSVDEYLAQLERMVEAQSNWETNMLLLSGRVSEGTLDELAKLGPEGAPLVADLVNASDEELARLEEAFSQRALDATGAFADTLNVSAEVIRAASAQLGDDAAREIAEKLANGTSTVEEIMAEYGLKIESIQPTVSVNADTSGATAALDNWIRLNSGRTVRISPVVDGPYGDRPGGGSTLGGLQQADGGVVSYFASGAVREQHVAQHARAGEWRVWAEPETGGESYIPHAPSKRGRSEAIMAETAAILGGVYIPGGAQQFANGGMTAAAPAPAGRGGVTVQVTAYGRDDSKDIAHDVADRIGWEL